jgi:hypothetical protein
MGKILEFRLPDTAASGYVGYETPAKPAYSRPREDEDGQEYPVFDPNLRKSFRIVHQKAVGGGLYVYFLREDKDI